VAASPSTRSITASRAAIEASGAEIVTVALRRADLSGQNDPFANILEFIDSKRYLVLPGITGLWQVSGRAELDFNDLVHLDFLYLEHWSLAVDLTILLKTIPAVLTRRGAY